MLIHIRLVEGLLLVFIELRIYVLQLVCIHLRVLPLLEVFI